MPGRELCKRCLYSHEDEEAALKCAMTHVHLLLDEILVHFSKIIVGRGCCSKTVARSTHPGCLAKLSPMPPDPAPYGNFAGIPPEDVYWDSMLRIWRAE